jgi:hypothetical protein
MGEYQDPTEEPNDDKSFSFTPPPPSPAPPRESLQAKLPRFTLLTSHQALSTNGELPDGIFTSTELWELYEHLTGDPLFGVMQLRHGLFTVVDMRHFASVTEQGWSPQYCEGTGLYYVRSTRKGLTETYLHRQILKLEGRTAKFVDHRNGDSLDNRSENLVEITRSDNLVKADRRALNATGHKGVQMEGSRFRGRFTYMGKTDYTSWFPTAGEAAAARKLLVAQKSPTVKELSAQERERLEQLRHVFRQMREGKLTLDFHHVRPFVVGKTAA